MRRYTPIYVVFNMCWSLSDVLHVRKVVQMRCYTSIHVVFNMCMNWCLSGVFHLLLLIVTCSKLSGKIGVNTEYVVVDLWCRSRVQKGERWCK